MEKYRTHRHTPPHLFRPNAVYMVTAGIFGKRRLLDTNDKKGKFLEVLFERAEILNWNLEAWAVLDNHYHFVARAPSEATKLASLIRGLHSISAKHLNQIDGIRGRKIWRNYWDTCITNERSYLARLHYVHVNPVKHGIVDQPEMYPFCSYRWFMDHTDISCRHRVFSQPINCISVDDDF